MSADVVRVSTSEALALTCETKWLFGFHPGYKLEAKDKGESITRGLIGHGALEVYYVNLMNGKSESDARKAATQYLADTSLKAMISGDDMSVKLVTEIMLILEEYYVSPQNQMILNNATILGVEWDYESAIAPGIIMPGRIDLLLKWHRGEWKGEITPVDHKFVYNFWSDRALSMNAQIPNYKFLVKQAFPDEVVSRGLINNLRYRTNAVEKFKIQPLRPTKTEIEEVLDNHVRLATRIVKYKAMPVDEAERTATRSISKYTCENCSFARLCKAKLNHRDTTLMIETEYQRNTYGYDKTEIEEEG